MREAEEQVTLDREQTDGFRPRASPRRQLLGLTLGRRIGGTVRVRGLTPQAFNRYDIVVTPLDVQGPQVNDVFLTTDSSYSLFDPKAFLGAGQDIVGNAG